MTVSQAPGVHGVHVVQDCLGVGKVSAFRVVQTMYEAELAVLALEEDVADVGPSCCSVPSRLAPYLVGGVRGFGGLRLRAGLGNGGWGCGCGLWILCFCVQASAPVRVHVKCKRISPGVARGCAVSSTAGATMVEKVLVP